MGPDKVCSFDARSLVTSGASVLLTGPGSVALHSQPSLEQQMVQQTALQIIADDVCTDELNRNQKQRRSTTKFVVQRTDGRSLRTIQGHRGHTHTEWTSPVWRDGPLLYYYYP
jgi:hypothetical protein